MLSSIPDLVATVATVTQTDGVGSPVDAEEVRERARDVLARAEFQDTSESLLDRILGWIGERLADLVLSPAGSGVQSIISYLLIGGLIAFVVWILVRSLRAPGRTTVRDEDTVTYGTENVRGPEVWLAEAERLVAAGDFRGALRCRHQALVAAWIVGGVIDHVVGQTARECHDAASRATDLDRDVSDEVVARFGEVWYGGRDVDATDYRTFAGQCDLLASSVRTRGRSGVTA